MYKMDMDLIQESWIDGRFTLLGDDLFVSRIRTVQFGDAGATIKEVIQY